MSEELAKRRQEEQRQYAAALVVQKRWRQYLQRRDEELEELVPTMTSPGEESLRVDAEPAPPLEEQREALLDEYRRLLSERSATIEQNLAYQRILSRHLAEQRARKGESEAQPLPTQDEEQQYWAMVRKMGDERRRLAHRRAETEEELERQRQRFQGTIDEAAAQEQNFWQYIKELATSAVYVRSNRGIPAAEVDAFLEAEESQRATIQAARIRYIQLTNYVKKLRHTAVESDRKNDGMYLIDFEQLKIENTNLNEKIEERNEDLVKLRRKVTTTIHVLTHVKEKLECVRGENAQLRQQVASTEEELNSVRDNLAQTKKRKDHFSRANARMKEKMPLVGSEDLLIDYENRKAVINRTRVNVVELTEKYTQLMEYIQAQQPVIESLRRALSQYPSTT